MPFCSRAPEQMAGPNLPTCGPWSSTGAILDCVEKALAGDVELARRYALVLEELAETINLNEALGEPSASVAETLFAAIDVEEALHRSAPNNTAPAPAWPNEPK